MNIETADGNQVVTGLKEWTAPEVTVISVSLETRGASNTGGDATHLT